MTGLEQNLRDRRLHLWQQLKAVAERAANANRPFSAAELAEWDRLNSEMSQLDARIKAVLDAQRPLLLHASQRRRALWRQGTFPGAEPDWAPCPLKIVAKAE